MYFEWNWSVCTVLATLAISVNYLHLTFSTQTVFTPYRNSVGYVCLLIMHDNMAVHILRICSSVMISQQVKLEKRPFLVFGSWGIK